MNSNWSYKYKVDNLNDITNVLMKDRNIDTNLEFFPSELLPDFTIAKDMILDSINKSEKILIYGDYDVDGITATTILRKYLSYYTPNVLFKIPNRFTDGYGLNIKHAEEIVNKNLAELVITVDNGITAFEPIKYLKEHGIKVIVTDHHTCLGELPEADAIVNCHRADSIYPFSDLCGAAVAYKLAVGINDYQNNKYPNFQELMDLAAVATISDVVPLVDENRHFINMTLGHLAKSSSCGLAAIIKLSDQLKKSCISAEDVAFSITPLINASSRMDNIDVAINLFMTDDFDIAINLARELMELNEKRKLVEKQVTSEAMALISEQNLYNELVPIVVCKNGWHLGVIGITAAKIAEKYQCPVFVGTIENGIIHGSARAYGDFNIVDSLTYAQKNLKSYGGHMGAGGFALEEKNLQAFKDALDCYAYENPWNFDDNKLADALIPIDDINSKIIESINTLSPFGEANPTPVFISENVTIKSIMAVGKDRCTLKMTVSSESGQTLNCIGFSMPEYPIFLSKGEKVKIIYKLSINSYAGKSSPQAILIDVISEKNESSSLDIVSWEKEYRIHTNIINKNYDKCINLLADNNPSDFDYKLYIPFIFNLANMLLPKNKGILLDSLVSVLQANFNCNHPASLPTTNPVYELNYNKCLRILEVINETNTFRITITLGRMVYFSTPTIPVEKIRVTNTNLYKFLKD